MQNLLLLRKETNLIVHLPMKELISELIYIKSEIPKYGEVILYILTLFLGDMGLTDLPFML
jgi:hypothetical protein